MKSFAMKAQHLIAVLRIIHFTLFSSLMLSVNAEQGLGFNEALRLAEQQSPRLRSVGKQITATNNLIDSAAQLPAPVLSLAIDNYPVSGADRFSFGNDFMTMQRLSWMQEIPNQDKRSARKELALAQQNKIQIDALGEQKAVQLDTALAWLSRFYTEQQQQQLTALEQENEQLNRLTQLQFSAGKISATEALLPQQEAIELALLRDELSSKHTQASAQLESLIGDAAQRELEGKPPKWPLQLHTLQLYLNHHIDLQRIDADRILQRAKISEANAARHADWSYEFSYQKRGDQYGDMMSLQWGIELPFFDRGRREAELRLQFADANSVEAEREKLLREHAAILRSQFAEYERLQKKLARLQNEVLPLLMQKAALIKAQWLNGKSPLSELIAAHKEQLNNELNAIATQHELQQMTAILIYTYHIDQNAREEKIP